MDPSDNPKKGQVGLANLGNTCYLNAALQALRHIPDLTVFFHKHSDPWIHEKPSNEATLCKAYKELIIGLWSGSGPRSVMRPAGFLHYFRESLKACPTYEHMIAPRPHDSHEALVFLLDQLHEGMTKPLTVNVTAEEGSPVYKALMAWKEQVAPKYSPIVDYFFGLMEVSVTCMGCKKASCRYEPFNMLKVGFPNPKMATLEQCIDYEFKAEEIDEYQCDTCSPDPPIGSSVVKAKRHPGSIQRKIWRLPQNLILVLKRFNPNGSKCNANFTAESSQIFTKWFSEASPEETKTTKYNLQSIIDHHGHANGGHYVAQVKSPLTGLWNIYDDESVNMIQDGSKPFIGQPSYVLFYRKE
jgi:ubiquitin C-terminal hydrolase